MPDSLYERDALAWSDQQAELLRSVAGGGGHGSVDWANVIEEVQDVGRSELRREKPARPGAGPLAEMPRLARQRVGGLMAWRTAGSPVRRPPELLALHAAVDQVGRSLC